MVACLIATRIAAQPAPGPGKLVLYATSDTDGRLASPRCRQTPHLTRDRMAFAHQVGYFRQLRRQTAEAPGAFAPIALHLGDTVFPGPVGRFLLRGGPDGGRQLAEILDQLPFETLTLGNREVGLHRDEQLALTRGAQAVDLPLRAVNVVCPPEGGAEAVCDVINTTSGARPYDVVERGDVRILLVSALDPEIRQGVASSRLEGLEILDPAEVLERRLPEYRRKVDPDLVFLQYHAASETGTEAMVELARNVGGIDLITTNKQLGHHALPDESVPNGFVLAPETETYVVPVGRSPNHATVSNIHLTRDKGGGEWAIQRIDNREVATDRGPVDARTAELLWQTTRQLCRQWGRPISTTAPLEEPFDLEAFRTFVLNVMRFSATAEVALANRGAFLQTDNFPLSDHLTFADVFTILPYDNPLVVVRVTGQTLQAIADHLDGAAVATGLAESAGQTTVNGRPVRPDRMYSVATNQFVAAGGDEILDPSAIDSQRTFDPGWAEDPPPISEVVVHFVESGAFAERGPVDDRLSPVGNFPNLHRKLLWQFVGSANLGYNEISVVNPQVQGQPAYENSQLTVDSTSQFNLEGNLQANADSRNHGWDNSLLFQYSAAKIDGTESTFRETSDLIRGRSGYRYAGFRSRLGDQWWAPMPTVEMQVETEFDRPDDRDWRKFELTGIFGSTFRIFEPFDVKIGVDLRQEFNNPETELLYGLAAAYALDRTEVVDVFDQPVRFESELDFFLNRSRSHRLLEVRTTSRLFYSLFEDLNVTSTFSTFLFRSARVGAFGSNTQLTFGINYLWDEAVQDF
ncbi:MAG: 5'-nucleotidase C-terminal domain-containing protein [Bradymonadaceae bacterium]